MTNNIYQYKSKLYAEKIKNNGEWIITDHISRPIWVLPITDEVLKNGIKLTNSVLDDCPSCGGTGRMSTEWLGIGVCRKCKGTKKRSVSG